MNEQLNNIVKNIKEFWTKLSKKKKYIIIVGSVGLIIIALVIAFILNNKDYVVLFNNIDQEESVEVIKQLQENNVEYKYENDGTILIPEEQESVLRMQLAQSGHPRTGTNYDVFTQNIDFMTTDYEKKQYEIFQLQERIQDSIETISGVKEAIVTINLPQEKSFAWESDKKETSASVKINLSKGSALTQSQTNGIMQLVCKSVEGLKEENVAIIDTEGNSLVVSNEILQTNTMKLKMEIEKEFEEEIENSVMELLTTMYGTENVQVSAKSKINFDKKISEMLKYIPDEETKSGIPSNTQTEREITGPGETTGGVAGAETNAEASSYPGVVVEGDNIYFKDTNSINYLVSQLKEQIEHNPGNLENLTVAVVINKTNMKEEEITEVRKLVAFSTGVDIENVALYNMRFYDPDSPEPAIPVGADVTKTEDNLGKYLIIGGIALGSTAILIFIISLILRKRKKKKNSELAISNDSKEKAEKFSWQDIHEEIKVQETEEQVIKKQLQEFTRSNPEIAAQLIRTWLKGDDD